ncbi:MAG: DUF1611 domain-containing protein [Deltaproteobacteria bacterium HGW-Deltaproteobacteria-18]|nr:MAG: DUF1611 domain-containing protein [Deltaproteobacteria bacterium HGW-Deltaproteobacteria-18]
MGFCISDKSTTDEVFMNCQPLEDARKKRIKWAYTTRNVESAIVQTLVSGIVQPTAGDLLLAQVERIGQHPRLELTTSRRAEMFEGDEIAVVFGNRYAPDQFEAMVPDKLSTCHLVAAGGVAARMLNQHTKMKRPTRIKPLGLLADANGNPINLSGFCLPKPAAISRTPLVVVIAGTSMNSGKTTACASLVKGFARRGLRVAAAKITGTGAGSDYRALVDAGADPVYDFLDAGYVSTYRLERHDLVNIVMTIGGHLAAANPKVIVLEVADGLLQRETSRLFQIPEFMNWIDGVIFTANDALGAQAGVTWLAARQLPVIATTGVLTSSPLAIREAACATGLPVFKTLSLAKPAVASLIHDCLRHRRRERLRCSELQACSGADLLPYGFFPNGG